MKTNLLANHTTLVSSLLFASCLIMTITASAQADIFTWKNDAGSTVFSDQDHPKAKPLPTPQIQTFQAPTVKNTPPTSPAKQLKSNIISYTSLAITAPIEDASIWDNRGNLTVTLSLSPALQDSHQIQLLLDGSATLIKASSHAFLNIDRGTHSLQANIIDQQGTVLISSATIRFHIKRHSIRFPR